MAAVSIELPHHSYDIIIEPHSLERIGTLVRGVAPHDRCALFADETVFDLHGATALESLKSAGYQVTVKTMPSGEKYKTLDTIRSFYDALLNDRLERKSPVIALGGGVVGDSVGFVASSYLRGVPFIQCPTTLLSMVDASVGGKVGVNVPQGKNLIGAFYQPELVCMDPMVLQTLPPRELKCGLAECVKHGVIRDADLFDWTGANQAHIQALSINTMVELLERNVKIKAAVVMEDEKEAGVRAHLNFGHTFAHAIEATAGYGEIEHGEAVSLGMIAAAHLAATIGRCDASLVNQLTTQLSNIGLPVKAKLVPTEELMEAMKLDKKVKDNRIRLVLPDRLGAVSVVDDVPAETIAQAWSIIRDNQA